MKNRKILCGVIGFVLLISCIVVIGKFMPLRNNNVFDEIYNALTKNASGKNDIANFRYAFSRMDSLGGRGRLSDLGMISWHAFEYNDQNKEDYTIQIIISEDERMHIYIEEKDREDIYVEVKYLYDRSNNTVVEETIVHNYNMEVEHELYDTEKALIDKLKPRLHNFICEFIENNSDKTKYSVGDWGDYTITYRETLITE